MNDTTSPQIEKRRFEIRYAEHDTTDDDPYCVLGWHDTQEGAARLREAWKKRPSVRDVWVVDLDVAYGGNDAKR